MQLGMCPIQWASAHACTSHINDPAYLTIYLLGIWSRVQMVPDMNHRHAIDWNNVHVAMCLFDTCEMPDYRRLGNFCY